MSAEDATQVSHNPLDNAGHEQDLEHAQDQTHNHENDNDPATDLVAQMSTAEALESLTGAAAAVQSEQLHHHHHHHHSHHVEQHHEQHHDHDLQHDLEGKYHHMHEQAMTDSHEMGQVGHEGVHGHHGHLLGQNAEHEALHEQLREQLNKQLREQVEEQLHQQLQEQAQQQQQQQQQEQQQRHQQSHEDDLGAPTEDEVLVLRRKISKIMSVLSEEAAITGDEAGVLERVRELAAGATQSMAFAAASQTQPDALPPTPMKNDDDHQRHAQEAYTPNDAQAVDMEATPPGDGNANQPRFSFFYPPGNMGGQLFAMPQQTASSGVGAFPLLVAAAVAAQPAPIQAGPPPTPDQDGASSDGSVKRKRRPTKLYSCTYLNCNRQFTRHFNLQTHIKTHDPNRDKPFTCPLCDKSFGRKVDRDRHMNVHTKEKTHLCPYCSKTFTRKDALQRHVTARRCGPILPGVGPVFGGIGMPSIRMIGDVDGELPDDEVENSANHANSVPGTPGSTPLHTNVNGNWVLLPLGNMMAGGQNSALHNGLMLGGQRLQLEDGSASRDGSVDQDGQMRIMEVAEGEQGSKDQHQQQQQVHDQATAQAADVAHAAHAILTYQQEGGVVPSAETTAAMLAYQQQLQHQQEQHEQQQQQQQNHGLNTARATAAAAAAAATAAAQQHQAKPEEDASIPLEVRAAAAAANMQFSLHP